MPTEPVLTMNSTMPCGHGGSISPLQAQTKLKVDGDFVLVNGSLTNATVSGCGTTPDPNTTTYPCKTTMAQTSGGAAKLLVDQKPVLLESASGALFNAPGTPAALAGVAQTYGSNNAGHSRLKTE